MGADIATSALPSLKRFTPVRLSLNLRTKLIAGYVVVTCFTFLTATIGIWQTRRLADGLYEVGVVRLPGIQALQSIFEAKTALDASKRELMRGWADAYIQKDGAPPSARLPTNENAPDAEEELEPMEAAVRYPHDVPGLWRAVLVEEVRRQGNAWRRAEKGWREYEALPRTPEEDRLWREFAATWTAWRESYERVMDALEQARKTGDAAALAAARTENQDRLFDLARDSRLRLTELIQLSDRAAEAAKQTSIASRADAMTVRRVMVVTAVASVLGAIGCGIFISRRIFRAIAPMASAFTRVTKGDLHSRVPVESRDEFGRMATAMNQMIDSLEASEGARSRSAAELVDAAERLALALRTSQLGLWRRNLVTNEAEWDAQMFEHFGLPAAPQGPTREAVLALVVPEDRESVLKSWSLTPPVGETIRFQFQIIRPNGVRRHLEAHGVIQRIEGRASEWILGVVADITGIVESTVESARLRERLSQAQKMESLGGLAAGVAHDFNNLLTSIGGFIELAASSLPAQHAATELLAEARVGADSARDLVNRILTYARDSRETRRVSVALEQIVQQTMPLLRAALPAYAALKLNIGQNLAPVAADSVQIQQVLMNLCTNAAHAIGARNGEIRIDLRREIVSQSRPGHPEVPAGDYVCLIVGDDGCGMDAATQARIFEPYFTTRSADKGTGLGLANVADIVAAHAGGLTVTSAPGQGTEFCLFFPMTSAPRA